MESSGSIRIATSINFFLRFYPFHFHLEEGEINKMEGIERDLVRILHPLLLWILIRRNEITKSKSKGVHELDWI